MALPAYLFKIAFLGCFQRILRPNEFLNWESALRTSTLFTSTEVMHRPSSNCPLHVDIENTYQIRMEK